MSMTKRGLAAFVLCVLAAVWAPGLLGQFAADELAQRERWEDFLKTAAITGEKQIVGPMAVTSPWRLTLTKDGVTNDAVWKDIEGRVRGYLEGWKYEIAAYLLDKALGLNMVPPTVERRFHERPGSCQIWVPDCISLKQREEQKIKMPSYKVFGWNRATYLQRFWDNLIANEDRHQNQFLITKDWRMILIDHSRSFRTWKKLIYTERHPEGPKLMSELPRSIVERIKGLTFDGIKGVVGENLSDDEIRTMLVRRDLILAEMDRLIKKYGEAQVLY